MFPSKTSCLFLRTISARRITGDKHPALRQIQVFLPCAAFRKLPERKIVCLQNPRYIGSFIQRKITSQKAHSSVINLFFCQTRQRIIHGLTQLLIRCQAIFLHNRIHITADKENIRKSRLQLSVHSFQVTAEKMMQTYCKKQHRLRSLIQFLYHICYTVNGHVLQVAVQQILFFHNNK